MAPPAVEGNSFAYIIFNAVTICQNSAVRSHALQYWYGGATGFQQQLPKVGVSGGFSPRSSWQILPQEMEAGVMPDGSALQRRPSWGVGSCLPGPPTPCTPSSTCDLFGRHVLWQRPLTTSEKGLWQRAHCPLCF